MTLDVSLLPRPGECTLAKLRGILTTRFEVVNPGDDWAHFYAISLDNHTNNVFVVNADNEQDALDEVVDYCEKQKYTGFFADDEVLVLPLNDSLDSYLHAGNHGHWLLAEDVQIFKLPDSWSETLTYDAFNEGWVK